MSRAMVPWAGPVNAMPRNIDDNTSGQPHEKSRKIQENYRNFDENAKLLLNFRKCKFKEIKKLNSYITTYVQKSNRFSSPLP